MRGRVEVVVIGFEGNKFNGHVAPELAKLSDNGLIRIIDLLFVSKDKDGNLSVLEYNEVPPEVAEAYGSFYNSESTDFLDAEDAEAIGDLLENDSSAAVLVFEHLWFKDFKKALIESGGRLIASEMITDETVDAALAGEDK